MTTIQPGILPPIPKAGRYLAFGLLPDSDPVAALKRLQSYDIDASLVVGLGPSLVLALGQSIDGLRPFPSLVGPGIDMPTTPSALWCWLRADEPGELIHQTHGLKRTLASAFRLDQVVNCFKFGEAPDDLGLDLTGYEDGTENPKEQEALDAGVVQGQGPGLDGSSFVAAQQWLHDFDRFHAMSGQDRDHAIGRRQSDNEELEDAPESAHVKRTAQEDFEPEAFVIRRSMPWADASGEGLMFVAFGHSFDAFEAQLKRMAGLDDGIVDGLFHFSRPVSGAYFWCPPLSDGKLDLSAVGL